VKDEEATVAVLEFLRQNCGVPILLAPEYVPSAHEFEQRAPAHRIGKLIHGAKREADELLASFMGPIAMTPVLAAAMWKPFMSTMRKKKLMMCLEAVEKALATRLNTQ
jgi:hypothetical protein